MLKFLAIVFVILVAIRIVLHLGLKILDHMLTEEEKEAAKHNNYFPYKVDEDEF